MSRRPLSSGDVSRAIAVAAATVAADDRAARTLAASFAMRAAAVEALLETRGAATPDAALTLVALGGEADALRVAHAMSAASWDPLLVRVLAAVLRPLLPTSPMARTIARGAPAEDMTAALMSDPPRHRSAQADRRAA